MLNFLYLLFKKRSSSNNEVLFLPRQKEFRERNFETYPQCTKTLKSFALKGTKSSHLTIFKSIHDQSMQQPVFVVQ